MVVAVVTAATTAAAEVLPPLQGLLAGCGGDGSLVMPPLVFVVVVAAVAAATISSSTVKPENCRARPHSHTTRDGATRLWDVKNDTSSLSGWELTTERSGLLTRPIFTPGCEPTQWERPVMIDDDHDADDCDDQRRRIGRDDEELSE
jgi:hypothetical protein